MKKVIQKWLLYALIFGVILYSCIYFWGLHSDSFAFVQKSLMSSPAISSKVGHVEHVKLDPFGGYSESFVDDSRTARMSVNIKGSKADATAIVIVTKSEGAWELKQVVIDGKLISLR